MSTTSAGTAQLSHETVAADDWVLRARQLRAEGWWFEGLWCRSDPTAIVAAWGRRAQAHLLQLPLPGRTFPSISRIVPAADWFERAVRDGHGLAPDGHVDPRPFRYHENYPHAHADGQPLRAWTPDHAWTYPYLRHEGPGVFEIPVGPIHAGIIEPGHFHITTAGELILDLELRLNYTHKGTLALTRGRTLEHATRLLERLSGDNAAAHACAFAAACEAATATTVDPRVETARSLMVEMERLHNHVFDLYGISLVTGFAAAASPFHAMREELLRWNARLFGHRLLMNAVVPGGITRAPATGDLAAYGAALTSVRARFERSVALATNNSGLKERVEDTGRLTAESARELACVGPAARASGVERDARVDAPCLAYPRLSVRVATREKGDVASRMWVKIDETRNTLGLLQNEILPALSAGIPSTVAAPASADGEGVAQVEASRGAVLSWVRVADGRVAEAYQRDPSFLNWRGLQRAALRNIVPDFPLVNKSFNLSYSGSDA